MAIASADSFYKYYFERLEESAIKGDDEGVSRGRKALTDEINISMQGEAQHLIADIVNNLYDSDYDSIQVDMAKISLLGVKKPADRIVVLSFIWEFAAKYYANNPEEFIKRLKNPVHGKLF